MLPSSARLGCACGPDRAAVQSLNVSISRLVTSALAGGMASPRLMQRCDVAKPRRIRDSMRQCSAVCCARKAAAYVDASAKCSAVPRYCESSLQTQLEKCDRPVRAATTRGGLTLTAGLHGGGWCSVLPCRLARAAVAAGSADRMCLRTQTEHV